MHSYCSNNAVTLLNEAKSLKIRSIMNFKIQNLPAFHLPASQPAVRPGCANATALECLHNKGNCIRFTKLLFQRTFIHCHMGFLLSFIS